MLALWIGGALATFYLLFRKTAKGPEGDSQEPPAENMAGLETEEEEEIVDVDHDELEPTGSPGTRPVAAEDLGGDRKPPKAARAAYDPKENPFRTSKRRPAGGSLDDLPSSEIEGTVDPGGNGQYTLPEDEDDPDDLDLDGEDEDEEPEEEA